MIRKILTAFLVFALLLTPAFSLESGSDAVFEINDISINDPVGPGDVVTATITLANWNTEDNLEDLRLTAHIWDFAGREVGDDIKEDLTFTLDHAANTRKPKERDVTVSMQLPSDLTEDLYVLDINVRGEWEVEGGKAFAGISEVFEVEAATNSLTISEVRVPVRAVAGERINVAVTLLNNGVKSQAGLTLRATMPEFGVENSIVVTETLEAGTETVKYLSLEVPSSASSGLVAVNVNSFNSDVSATTEALVFVEDAAPVQLTQPAKQPVQGMATANLEQNKGSVVTLTVTNNEATTQTYDLSLGGVRDWTSSARVDPVTVTIQPGASQSVNVFLLPTSAGTHTATLFVKEGGSTVSFVSIDALVEGGSVVIDGVDNSTAGFVFVAVVVILAIAAAVWQKNRNGSGKEASVYY